MEIYYDLGQWRIFDAEAVFENYWGYFVVFYLGLEVKKRFFFSDFDHCASKVR